MKITIEADSYKELSEFAVQLLGGPAPSVAFEAPQLKEVAEVPKAETVVEEQPAVENTTTVTVEDIMAAAAKLIRDGSVQNKVLQEMNARFGIISMRDLRPDQLGDYAMELVRLGATF